MLTVKLERFNESNDVKATTVLDSQYVIRISEIMGNLKS